MPPFPVSALCCWRGVLAWAVWWCSRRGAAPWPGVDGHQRSMPAMLDGALPSPAALERAALRALTPGGARVAEVARLSCLPSRLSLPCVVGLPAGGHHHRARAAPFCGALTVSLVLALCGRSILFLPLAGLLLVPVPVLCLVAPPMTLAGGHVDSPCAHGLSALLGLRVSQTLLALRLACFSCGLGLSVWFTSAFAVLVGQLPKLGRLRPCLCCCRQACCGICTALVLLDL